MTATLVTPVMRDSVCWTRAERALTMAAKLCVMLFLRGARWEAGSVNK